MMDSCSVLHILVAFLFAADKVSSQEQVSYRVTEEKLANSYIGNIARDSGILNGVDGRTLQTILFSFLSNDNSNIALFNLNSETSEFSTAIAIDRETICELLANCVISLDIVAKSSTDTFFKVVNVMITIDDKNDNSPTFPSPTIALNIPENVQLGAKFIIDGATDADTGENSINRYYLRSSSSNFELSEKKTLGGSSILSLVVASSLDRETTSMYSIVIFAEDQGTPRRSGSATIQVHVVDVNDNTPVFDMSEYNITVSEDVQLNTSIATLNATDSDAGENGQIRYRLSARQPSSIHSLFRINEVTGDIYMTDVLQSTATKHMVLVEAADLGDQPLFAQAILNVYMLDTVNSPPEVQLNLLTDSDYGEIPEDAKIGTVLAYFRVSDSDSGNNGITSCSIQGSVFGLESFSSRQYKIVLRHLIDRETTSSYPLSFTCSDMGSPSLHVTSSFTVKVRDVNDNAPRFQQDTYEANINENNNIGDFITRVIATDKDSDGHSSIIYIVGESDRQLISIDPTSGVIRANGPFDREVKDIYTIKIYARDSGEPSLMSHVTLILTILDVNDCRPEFAQEHFNFYVAENLPIGIIAGVLSANDKDDSINTNISFSTYEDADLPFALSSGGRIFLNRVLDREMQSRYDFYVVANDNGEPALQATSQVTVFVVDVNDNVPVILFPNNTNRTIKVTEPIESDVPVGSVLAFDPDEDLNGKLSYSLRGDNSTEVLIINPRTGHLYISQHIDLSSLPAHMRYTVVVSDNGIQPLVSTEVLNVELGLTSSHLQNGTIGDNKLTFIAIAIGIVTVLVVIIIVATLFIIRRMDNSKPGMGASDKTAFQRPDDSIEQGDRSPPSYTDVFQITVQNEQDKSYMIGETVDDVIRATRPTHVDFPEQRIPTFQEQSFSSALKELKTVNSHRDEIEINSNSDSGKGGSEEDLRYLSHDGSGFSDYNRREINSRRSFQKRSRKVTFDDSKTDNVDNGRTIPAYHQEYKHYNDDREPQRMSSRDAERHSGCPGPHERDFRRSGSVTRGVPHCSGVSSESFRNSLSYSNRSKNNVDNRRQPGGAMQNSAGFLNDYKNVHV